MAPVAQSGMDLAWMRRRLIDCASCFNATCALSRRRAAAELPRRQFCSEAAASARLDAARPPLGKEAAERRRPRGVEVAEAARAGRRRWRRWRRGEGEEAGGDDVDDAEKEDDSFALAPALVLGVVDLLLCLI